MKFKGHTVKGTKKQYTLKEQLGEGGFSLIYSTNDPQTICKVQVLSNPEIMVAYKNQKTAMLALQNKYIVSLKDHFEVKQKQGNYGFLMMENCSNGNAFNVLQKYENKEMPEKIILKIIYAVSSALQYMHKKGITHRDIKLQNVLLNAKGQYKLCDFGSSSSQVIREFTKENRVDIEENIEKTTTPLYRSPEQLDLYSGFEIGNKVDVFALGVLAFMLCFQKQPFESRLSAINKQFFIPQQTSYSTQLIQLIENCFTTNPAQRPTASEVKAIVRNMMDKKVAQIDISLDKELDGTLAELLKVNSNTLKKSTQVAETGFFDKIKRIYNQITTQTQGWIAGFVEDNEQAPQLKYNRSIISKCWEKRYKAEKMYQILFKYSQDYKTKCLVNVKLLILLHNFLRKGPPQSISCDNTYSSHKICSKIYRNWKMTQKPTDSDDLKRNAYTCLIIRYYSLVLVTKWKLCFENSDLIEGNYSILPFFNSKKQKALLKLPFIEELIDFLEVCVQFHEILDKHSYLVQIQRSIILSLVDEEYCLISLVVFLICGFKEAIPFLAEDLDIDKLSKKMKNIERRFQMIFQKVSKLFESAHKLASLFEGQSQFLLNPKIPQYIKDINITERKKGVFELNKHINYSKSILGLKIPVSYQEAVKNPNYLKILEKQVEGNTNTVEVNQFKIKKQEKEKQIIHANKNQPLAGEDAFKKNKQNKVFSNDPFNQKTQQQHQSNSQKSNSQSQINQQQQQNHHKPHKKEEFLSNQQIGIMEFTHQNLNKDMKHEQQQQHVKKPNSQFRDFLSIVDEKYSKSTSSLNNNTNNHTTTNINTNNQFSMFNTVVSSVSSAQVGNCKNSSPEGPILKAQNNINSPKSTNNNNNNDKVSSPSNNSPTTMNRQQGQVKKFQDINYNSLNSTNKDQMTSRNSNTSERRNQNQQQDSVFYSSISSLSKDVYDSLNPQQQAKRESPTNNQKMELMNFFDDQEEPTQQQKPQETAKEVPNSQTHILNRTNPDGFAKKTQKSLFGQGHGGGSQKVIPLENSFKTMPSDYSFIDLKGFIVEEVKKNADQYFIEFSSLKFYGKVGFGHSSEVFKGQWRGREVAIKRIKDNMSPNNAKEFKRQIMTSVKIRHHPNLVTLIGIAEYQSEYYIINEFCNGATLFDFLHQSSFQISMKARLSIARQIAKGMVFLQTNDPPIIHRDLKSLNVLLVNKYNGEDEPQIKIADFGLSRDFASTYMTGTLGTFHWMAPEIFNNEPYTLKADVYSFGIVLWEILARSPPYTNLKNPQSLMKFITLQNGRPDLNLIGSDCPQALRMLMIRCWDRFPENRPNFKEILATLNNIQA